MNWLKKYIDRIARSFQKPSETGSPPTDPLSQAASQIWSPAFLKELTEDNVFARIHRENENLRGVPEKLREPEKPLGSSSETVRISGSAPTPAAAAEPLSTEPAATQGTIEKKLDFGPDEYTRPNFQKVLEQELRRQFGKDVKIRWIGDAKIPEFREPSASPPVTPQEPARTPESAMTSKAGVDYVRGPMTYFRSIEDLCAHRPAKRTPLTGGGHMLEAADQFGAFEARYDRKDRLRSFTRTERFKEVFGKPIAETKIWIYDPQADELLDKESEEYMREQIEQYGAEAYLTTLCERHGVNPHPWPPSEYEFVRSIRKLVRGLKIYEGEKFIQ